MRRPPLHRHLTEPAVAAVPGGHPARQHPVVAAAGRGQRQLDSDRQRSKRRLQGTRPITGRMIEKLSVSCGGRPIWLNLSLLIGVIGQRIGKPDPARAPAIWSGNSPSAAPSALPNFVTYQNAYSSVHVGA